MTNFTYLQREKDGIYSLLGTVVCVLWVFDALVYELLSIATVLEGSKGDEVVTHCEDPDESGSRLTLHSEFTKGCFILTMIEPWNEKYQLINTQGFPKSVVVAM